MDVQPTTDVLNSENPERQEETTYKHIEVETEQ
jgi:hypothetical protein